MPISIDRKRFEHLKKVLLEFPEATCSGEVHSAFRVRRRTFAYHLVDHHGDGRIALCVKAEFGENLRLAREQPERYFVPPYIGPKGWVGLDIGRGRPDWREIEWLAITSYRLVAPASLSRALGGVIAGGSQNRGAIKKTKAPM
jgi:YjbR